MADTAQLHDAMHSTPADRAWLYVHPTSTSTRCTRTGHAVLGDMLCSNPEDVYILSPTSQSYAQDELCVVVLLSSWCILLVADAATLEDVYSTAQHVHPPTST